MIIIFNIDYIDENSNGQSPKPGTDPTYISVYIKTTWDFHFDKYLRFELNVYRICSSEKCTHDSAAPDLLCHIPV